MKVLLLVNDGDTSEISNAAGAQSSKTNINSDQLNANLFEPYPILVPLNLVIPICFKDTLLLDKLHVHVNDCDSYPCMFSKIIEDESMKPIALIIQNGTVDNSQEFKQSIQDCRIWWKLFRRFSKNANPRRELGRCLFQTFSSKCRQFVLDKIKLLLITPEEEQGIVLARSVR